MKIFRWEYGHAEMIDHPTPKNHDHIMLFFFNSISWFMLVGGDSSVRKFYPVMVA